MFAFIRRRTSAATEALLLATIVALLAAVTGTTAMSEQDRFDARASSGQTSQVLVGRLDVKATELQADGSHWSATLQTGGRTIAVRISHEDSHRDELDGAAVQVQGLWSGDGTFVAMAIDPVDQSALPVGDEASDAVAPRSAPRGKRTQLEGVLSVGHGDDFSHGKKTATRYFLSTANGQTEVFFDRRPSPDLAGARVKLTGIRAGNTLNVAAGGTTMVASSTSSPSNSSTGSHKVAVVLLNFSNDISQPYTPAYARGIAFSNSDSVAAYYNEASWGQLTLSGDVLGWYTIPATNANCDLSTWANLANQAASAENVTLSAYDNVVYAFPSTSCGWAGLANMPGRNSYLNGASAMTLRVMAHELGHNFGTHHANQLNCTEGGIRVSLSVSMTNCTSGEYGDPFSIMGAAAHFAHTNFARGNFDWLAGGNTKTVSASGDYQVTPVDVQSSTTVSSLRIQRTSGTYLTMEFRQPYGAYFETFAPTSPVATGVTIRITAAYASRTQSQLIDTTPGTTTFNDAPLAAGEAFFDPLIGVSITTLATSSGGATVRISFGSGGPTPSPTPTSSPGPTPAPTPGPTPAPTPAPSPTATPTPPDTQPPTAPTDLKASIARSKKVALTWSASSDDVRVVGYRVYRDGTLVVTVTNTKWNDSLTFKGGSRLYDVVAFDAAGNVSPQAAVTVQ